jgi:hypothetical protein
VNVRRNLSEQAGRNVSPLVHRHRGHAAVRVPKLFVGTTLPDLAKPQALEQRDHLTGFEDGHPGHDSGHDGLDADEFGFKAGLAILEEKGDDFLQVAVELVERLSLAVRPGESGHVANEESGVRVPLDDRSVGLLHTLEIISLGGILPAA